MQEQRDPTNLLVGQIWVGWGPQVERALAKTEAVVELLMEQTGRSRDWVKSTIAQSQELERYLLTERLSNTAHAAVYRGVDRKLPRGVALKIHHDRQRHDAEQEIYQSRSAPLRASGPSPRAGLVESRTMSRLSHPNIVQIYDMGEHDMGERGAWLFSVMELCDETLNDYCSRHDWPQIIDRFVEAINGLAWLHDSGYAHGDIKGSNILIKNGTAKLSDFGFARMPKSDDPDDDELSRLFHKYVCGTPGFMAPEVAADGPGLPGDIFALAVTMWIAVHREPPFRVPEGEDLDAEAFNRALVRRATEGEIRPPDYVPMGLPSAIPKILRRALHPDPRKRPKLGRILKVLNAARDEHDRRMRRRRTVLASVGGAMVTLGLGFTIGAAHYRGTATGSIVYSALGELDPLARAEIAAKLGDGETVRKELNQEYSHARKASKVELQRISQRVVGIVSVLGQTSPNDVPAIQLYLDGFRQLERRASSTPRSHQSR